MYQEQINEILNKYIIDYDLCSVSYLHISNINCGDSNLFYNLDDLVKDINRIMKIKIIEVSKFVIKFFLKDDKGFKNIAQFTITKEEIENLKKGVK